jgi:hypothetical protein
VRRQIGVLAVSALLLTALGASPAPALEPVASVGPPTPIAAWNGRLVWSVPDGSGGYRLVQRSGDGAITPIPVPSRQAVPFDVDLGPTSSGGTYAVYSRCQVEPEWDKTGMPDYRLGKGCDVYKLDLATNQEVRYTKANSSDGSEYWPSYWKGTIAFARAYEKDPAKPYLYSKKVSSSAPSEKLPGGSRGSRASTPLQVEVYGSYVAFAWTYRSSNNLPTYELRVNKIGGEGTRLDVTSGSELSKIALGWPAFDGDRVSWVRSCLGDPGGCGSSRRLQQSPYTGSPRPFVAESPAYVQSLEIDGDDTWIENDTNAIYGCRTDPVSVPQCEIAASRPEYAQLREDPAPNPGR